MDDKDLIEPSKQQLKLVRAEHVGRIFSNLSICGYIFSILAIVFFVLLSIVSYLLGTMFFLMLLGMAQNPDIDIVETGGEFYGDIASALRDVGIPICIFIGIMLLLSIVSLILLSLDKKKSNSARKIVTTIITVCSVFVFIIAFAIVGVMT